VATLITPDFGGADAPGVVVAAVRKNATKHGVNERVICR
jgi:hypothetical protein